MLQDLIKPVSLLADNSSSPARGSPALPAPADGPAPAWIDRAAAPDRLRILTYARQKGLVDDVATALRLVESCFTAPHKTTVSLDEDGSAEPRVVVGVVSQGVTAAQAYEAYEAFVRSWVEEASSAGVGFINLSYGVS